MEFKSKAITKAGGHCGRFKPWVVSVGIGAIVLVTTATVRAADQDSGWYGGLNLGRSRIGSFNGGPDSAFASRGLNSATSVDKRDDTYSLNLGYQFSRNFALEGGYVDLGKFDLRSAISAPATDTAHGNYKADGWTFTGVGILPLQNGVALYGKAGLLFSDVKLNANSDTGAVPLGSWSKSSTDGTYGLGLSYDFGNGVLGKVEWNRYQDLGDSSSTGKFDLNTYTVGVSYRF